MKFSASTRAALSIPSSANFISPPFLSGCAGRPPRNRAVSGATATPKPNSIGHPKLRGVIEIRSRSARELGFSSEDAMIQAGRRLRPIAMTALATIGMLPLAFAIGAGSQMLQPLAITVVGGILSSMVLSLIFTPAIHYYLQPKQPLKNSPAS